ncbi:MAG: T9SS type A sorting domain-containing protein [Chitinophagales bacterium]|nr:T9SS type A sorting domain-containing protein [Chitinophagales bacterium]
MKTIKRSVNQWRLIVQALFILLLTIPAFAQAQTWKSLGSGVPYWSYSVGTWNNQLFAGTTGGIYKWDGQSWTVVGDGLNGEVDAILEYNGELIAAGKFTMSGTKTLNFIAKWNGTTWKDMAGGMNSYVTSLAVYNGKLIAGGYFTKAEGTAKYIAQWDGSHWTSLGSGMGGTQGQVMALTVYGSDLIATGFFTKAGGMNVNYIAKWNGTAWSALGSGLGYIGYALTAYNGKLVAGGLFSSAGGVSASDIAMWNGSSWSALGTGIGGGVYGYVFALTVYGSDLVAAGIFTTAGGLSAANIAKWDGYAWSPLAGSMSSGGTVQGIFGLVNFGGDVVAGGIFDAIEATGSPNVAAVNYTPSGNFITSVTAPSSPYCNNQVVNIGYTVVGAFTAGNVFTAQLSDANGSFTAPVTIGTKNSIASGMIVATIPNNTLTGSKYRIRVVSSNPVVSGPDNGTDLVIGTPISTNDPTAFCVGGSAKLTVVTPAISYQWKMNGAIIQGKTAQTYKASEAGNYTCDVTNSCGTTTSNTIALTTNPKPTSTISVGNCAAGIVTLTDIASPATGVTYKWTLNGNNISGATNSTYAATVSGSYKCKVTIIETGCSANSKSSSVTITCKMHSSDMNTSISVFPNPSGYYFTISDLATGIVHNIDVFDITGRHIENAATSDNEIRIGESWSPGIYFARISDINGEDEVIKLIKD